MGLFKLLCQLLAAVVIGVAVVVVVRTLSVRPPEAEEICNEESTSHYISLNGEMLNRLSKAISFKTISHDGEVGESPKQLQELREFIINSYPTIHGSPFIQLEVVNNYSLLYTVRGSQPSLQPYLLAAHLDVVPADPARWDVPPFEGRVQDGYIYGRGTLDDKSQDLAILEALETMLKDGFQPKRGFFIAFGHDEELSGHQGAKEIGRILVSRGVRLSFLVDEGTMILQGVFNMVDNPVAVISVSEKGYVTFRLTADGVNAHSSFPPLTTSIGILAKAISRLEDNPHPNKFGLGTEKTMLELLAPYTSILYRAVFANIWLFSPILSRIMSRDSIRNSLVRTTTAVTMVHGGIKSNVIPASSWAVVNHRIYPTESVAEVLEFDRKIVNDERVKFEIVDQVEPAPTSPHSESTFGFQMLKKSIRQVFPTAAVVPGLMIGGTDTKWYHQLTNQIYRFSPFLITPNDTNRYHGDNERISVKNYEQVINYYHHLITNCDLEQIVVENTKKSEL